MIPGVGSLSRHDQGAISGQKETQPKIPASSKGAGRAITRGRCRELLADLRALIHDAREQVAGAVNSALVLLCWHAGHRIHTEVLKENRAAYGEQIIPGLAAQLGQEFGRGFAEKNLRRMTQLAEIYPTREIVVTLSRQLSWRHFLALLPLKDSLKRDFYAEMCRIERWSVLALRGKIGDT